MVVMTTKGGVVLQTRLSLVAFDSVNFFFNSSTCSSFFCNVETIYTSYLGIKTLCAIMKRYTYFSFNSQTITKILQINILFIQFIAPWKDIKMD